MKEKHDSQDQNVNKGNSKSPSKFRIEQNSKNSRKTQKSFNLGVVLFFFKVLGKNVIIIKF